MISLERFIPATLAGVYPFWKMESLDGILPSSARKLDPHTAEILGTCILITNQTVTRLYARLKVASQSNRLAALEFRVGEADGDTAKMVIAPYGSKAAVLMHSNPEAGDSYSRMRYVYSVGGEFE